MRRNRVKCLVVLLFASLSMVLSCAREEELVSIEVQPSGGFIFEGAGASGQLTALGHFIHPPRTKDITSQVTWRIDVANFATVSSTGFVTYDRADGCGSGDVIATHSIHPGSSSLSGPVVVGTTFLKGVNDGTDVCKP